MMNLEGDLAGHAPQRDDVLRGLRGEGGAFMGIHYRGM